MTIYERLSPKAIIIGIFFELCCYVMVFVLGVALGALMEYHHPPGEVPRFAVQVAQTGTRIISATLLYLVGYITGRVARHAEVLHAGIVACVFASVGFFGDQRSSASFALLYAAGGIVLHLVGGWTAQMLRCRREVSVKSGLHQL